MIKVKAKAVINGKTVYNNEGKYYSAVFDAEKEIRKHLYKLYWNNGKRVPPPVEGQKDKLTIELSWECTMNGRAPARPKDVIAAEKERRAAERKQKDEQKAQWEKEQQERIVNVRKRIKHQVDYAFITGKSGTEPASKYITCEHCSAPAEFLLLNQKPSPGAAVLDEDTIVGAICATHNWRNGNEVKIPCAKLEFFYDGIRQIAIKR